MTLTIYSQKVLIEREVGKFFVDKIMVYRVSRWRLLQALFTGAIKGEWPPKGKSATAGRALADSPVSGEKQKD